MVRICHLRGKIHCKNYQKEIIELDAAIAKAKFRQRKGLALPICILFSNQ
jgi:hypothetical protein